MTQPTCSWCSAPPVRAITTRHGDVPDEHTLEGKPGKDRSVVVVVRACQQHRENLVGVLAVEQTLDTDA